MRRGLAGHLTKDIRSLTRRQIVAEADRIAATGKRSAADDMRKHTHTFLEWCVSRGFVDTNVLAGYRNPKQTRAERVGRRQKGGRKDGANAIALALPRLTTTSSRCRGGVGPSLESLFGW
jgi:hypothetical protein